MTGHIDNVKYLLEHGADIAMKDNVCTSGTKHYCIVCVNVCKSLINLIYVDGCIRRTDSPRCYMLQCVIILRSWGTWWSTGPMKPWRATYALLTGNIVTLLVSIIWSFLWFMFCGYGCICRMVSPRSWLPLGGVILTSWSTCCCWGPTLPWKTMYALPTGHIIA